MTQSDDERLPTLLSVIAGSVDVIGYLSLGLFTAHVTGNLVVIAALLVRGGPPNLTQILAVPVFIAAVAAVWLIAEAADRRGPALARPLLVVHFLLLCCVLIFMACQFSLLRLAVPGAPSTAVMTGNLTNAVLSLLDTLWHREPLIEGAHERLKKTVRLLAGFFAGCVVGAAAVSLLGDWAWSLPVALAGAAVAFR